MAIAKMSMVRIIGEAECLDDVIVRCLHHGGFHPEKTLPSSEAQDMVPVSQENPCAELFARYTEIGMQAGLLRTDTPAPATNVSIAQIVGHSQYYNDFANSFSSELEALRERLEFLSKAIEQDENALVYLSHLAKSNINFDALISCRYITTRFGRIPADSYVKLALYAKEPFIFVPFEEEANYYWGAYFAPIEDAAEIDDMFSSLYFEPIELPEFIHGTPAQAHASLTARLQNNREDKIVTEQRIADLAAEKKETFYQIYGQLSFVTSAYGLRPYVVSFKRRFLDMFCITGFVEQQQAESFAQSLQELEGVSVEIRAHNADKRVQTPTKLKNGWFSRPFEAFVEMYGLPAYGDFDPTGFVAFTYCLLFGIMFGDVGQGLLLVLGGQLIWKYKRMNLGRIISRVGIFSSIMGVVYGSVFGFEHLLDPLFKNVFGLPEKPIEVMSPTMTNPILFVAVGLGILLICTSIILDIIIGLRAHKYERALFSANGLAGLVFYTSLLFAVVMRFIVGINYFSPPYIALLLLLPLAVILFKKPLGKLMRGASLKEARPEEPMGAYLTEGVFELFEVVLSFFSNTMSFLRVGGFVLSHAGMMAVVMTLSEMVGQAASPIVIIIGNLFVIGMEGLIVGIQVLRLEYYELFSRFFDGDGKPFAPFKISLQEHN